MRLSRLLQSNLARSKARLGVVGAAVAVGVSVLVVLGALAVGIHRGVIAPMLPRLPLDLLKVEPRMVNLGLLAFDASQLSGGLDQAAVERLSRIEGVAHVYPVVGAAFPMRAEGGEGFLGRRLRTDLFATGLDPALVEKDVAPGQRFVDPGPTATKVPVLVSRRLLELYNSTVAPAIDKPRLSPEMVVGFGFELELGASYASGTPDPARVRRVVAEIVGLSDQANLVGITLPEALVRRWNAEQGKAVSPIAGAFVRTRSPEDAGEVAAQIERSGLKVDDTPKLIGAGLAIGALILGSLVATLLFLAGFAIAQTFFLLVAERWTELAILRAMGARRRDLRRLVLAEAGVVGLAGGLCGVLLGCAVALGLEAAVLGLLPDLPFRPERLVSFPPLLLLAAWGLGVAAALLGAAVPAARAAAASPSVALRT